MKKGWGTAQVKRAPSAGYYFFKLMLLLSQMLQSHTLSLVALTLRIAISHPMDHETFWLTEVPVGYSKHA